MSEISPTNPLGNQPPINPAQSSSNPPPSFQPSQAASSSFAATYWHFTPAEVQKFLSNLADTIINEIKHEDEKAQQDAQKLKEAETDGDGDDS